MTSLYNGSTAHDAYLRAEAAAAHAGELAARILPSATNNRRIVIAFAEAAERSRQVAGDHYRSNNPAAAEAAADLAVGAASALDRLE